MAPSHLPSSSAEIECDTHKGGASLCDETCDWGSRCRHCKRPLRWHDESSHACPDDLDYPHPDSEYGAVLADAARYGIEVDAMRADFDFLSAQIAKLDALRNPIYATRIVAYMNDGWDFDHAKSSADDDDAHNVPMRTILVHLNVSVPVSNTRSADDIAESILQTLKACAIEGIEIVCPLAEDA